MCEVATPTLLAKRMWCFVKEATITLFTCGTTYHHPLHLWHHVPSPSSLMTPHTITLLYHHHTSQLHIVVSD